MIYKIRVRPADDFDPSTFDSRELRKGLTAVYGRPKAGEPDCDDTSAVMMPGMPAPPAVPAPPPRPMRLQSLQFNSDSFTLEKAFDWMNEYGYKVERLEFARQWFAQFSDGDEYVSREADLFEAGEYPDRNLTVTEADITRLAATQGAIPIHVEHAGGPVKLGEVGGLRAVGRWLKGTLNLFPEANALLDRLGVNTLSVAVSRALDRVHEVSVTGTPRVAGARMFSGESELVVFSLGEQPHGGEGMPEVSAEQFTQLQAQFADLQAKLTAETEARAAAESENAKARQTARELTFAMRTKDAEATIEPFVQKGIVKPAQRDAAVALLLSDAVVTFSDADRPVAELFAGFLGQMTPVIGPSVRGNFTDTTTKEERIAFYVAKGLSPEGAEKAAEIEMAGKE